MKQLNDILNERKQLNKQLNNVKIEYNKQIEKLTNEINIRNKKIDNYKHMNTKAANGAQFIKSIKGNAENLLKVVNYIIAHINEGKIADFLEENQYVGYFYNSDIDYGRVYKEYPHYSQVNTVLQAHISFEQTDVTSEKIVAILNYLKYLKTQFTQFTHVSDEGNLYVKNDKKQRSDNDEFDNDKEYYYQLLHVNDDESDRYVMKNYSQHNENIINNWDFEHNYTLFMNKNDFSFGKRYEARELDDFLPNDNNVYLTCNYGYALQEIIPNN